MTRRRARSCSSSRRGPTRSGSRRSCGRVGLPTYRAAGRNYFGQQQVVDLLAYLRLLQNRYDDEALLTVLASPFVGVSNDALVLIRAEAQRQPIFRGLERALPGDLSDDDRRLLLAFRQRYERLLDARVPCLPRAPLRAGARRARLRPRGPRAPRRAAPLREPPQARAPRPVVRGAPRRRPARASSASSRGRRRSARRSRTRSPRRRAPTPSACSRSTPPRASSSRSSSSPTLDAAVRPSPTSSRSPTGDSGSRSPIPRRARA